MERMTANCVSVIMLEELIVILKYLVEEFKLLGIDRK
jgi:hypothetical protein